MGLRRAGLPWQVNGVVYMGPQRRSRVLLGPTAVNDSVMRLVGDGVLAWAEAWTRAGWVTRGYVGEVLYQPAAAEAQLRELGVPEEESRAGRVRRRA